MTAVVGPRDTRRSRFAVVAAAAVFGITYGLSSPLIALALDRDGYSKFAIGLNAAMQALGILTVALLLPGATSGWRMRGVLLAALVMVGGVLLGELWKAPLRRERAIAA